jgi:hypothetical protein
MADKPASTMKMDSTAAKIGRLMKKREKFMSRPYYFLAAAGAAGCG